MQSLMSNDFAVRCKACEYRWNSAAMADGLRILGVCPKCKGDLEFGAGAGAGPAAPPPESSVSADAPHLVLGIPRI
ncbi:MAG: hypothetical protein QOK49_3806 [Baekduia sp.]|jgi:hypothetical protein|nr:hypothetical protein [Baekduia sp.]